MGKLSAAQAQRDKSGCYDVTFSVTRLANELFLFRSFERVLMLEQVCRFFRDHQDASMAISRRNKGHDAGIYDPESCDAVDLQARIHDGESIQPHIA